PHRVLIVDDSPISRRLLSYVLSKLDCRVSLAVTLAEADALISDQTFDMVILDAQLPDGDGFAFCRKLREQVSDLPVIFYTATDTPEIRVKAEQSGGSAFIVKTRNLDLLKAAVSKILS